MDLLGERAFGHVPETGPIDHFDVVLGPEPYQPPVAQIREHPAYGFLRQTQVIGNVQPAHRQVETGFRNAAGALGPLEQR